MNLQLDPHLHRWLFGMNLLPLQSRKLKNNKIELPLSTTSSIENGALILKLLRLLAAKKNKNIVFPSDLALKNQSTPSSRLYNWNIISDLMKKMGLGLSEEMKGLIVNGDTPIMNEFFRDLYEFFAETEEKTIDIDRFTNHNISMVSKQSNHLETVPDRLNESIDLMGLDMNKPIEKTETLLEFLVFCLSKNLKITPKQTVSLFTKNLKYLAHVLIKGVKASFDPIILFYSTLSENIVILNNFLLNDTSSSYLAFLLNALKPGLTSKNQTAGAAAASFFLNFAENLPSTELQIQGWEWIVAGGMQTCLMGIRRHPENMGLLIDVMRNFGRANLKELFTKHLHEAVEDEKEYFSAILVLYDEMSSKWGSSDLVNSGILNSWVEASISLLNREYISSELSSGLIFITNIWLEHPFLIETPESRALSVISFFSRSSKHTSPLLLLQTLSLLFRLLERFLMIRNAYAPFIYKTITFMLIENINSTEVRSFVLENLKTILTLLPERREEAEKEDDLKKDNTLLSILLDPLFKKIQIEDSGESVSFQWQPFDFSFFLFLLSTPTLVLSLRSLIQTADCLAKIILNDHIYGPSALKAFEFLLKKDVNFLLHDFLAKLVKIALAIYFASSKKIQLKKGKKGVIGDEEQTLSAKQRIIIELLVKVGRRRGGVGGEGGGEEGGEGEERRGKGIGGDGWEERMKVLVVHTNIQIKRQITKGVNDKGMIQIMNIWGEGEKILNKYEKEFKKKEEEEKRKEEEKKREVLEGVDKKEETLFKPDEGKAVANRTRTEDDEGSFERDLKAKGIGYKETKSISNSSIIRKFNKVDPRIASKLEKITSQMKNRKSIEDLKQEEALNQQSQEAIRKKKLRKHLELRSFAHGVSPPSSSTPPLLPFNSLSLPSSTSITPTDLSLEEDFERRGVEEVWQKMGRLIKFLFLKYANSSNHFQKPETFGEIGLENQKMTVREAWGMVKELGLGEKVSKDFVHDLISSINLRYFKQNDNTIYTLAIPSFRYFLLDLALFVFPPSIQPLSSSLFLLFSHFKKNDPHPSSLYQDLELFKKEDEIKTKREEGDAARELSLRLKKNPEYVLPEGWRKVKEERVEVEFKMKEGLEAILGIWGLAYSIIDQICNEKFQFSLYEPLSSTKEVYVAKPKLLHPISPRILRTVPSLMPPSSSIFSSPSSFSPLPQAFRQKKKVLEIAHRGPLPMEMKVHVGGMEPKYRYIAEEVGYLLSDMITAVEKSMPSLPIANVSPIIKRKEEKEKALVSLEREKEEERKKRTRSLRKMLEESGIPSKSPEERRKNIKKRFEEVTKTEEKKEEKKKQDQIKWTKLLSAHKKEKNKEKAAGSIQKSISSSRKAKSPDDPEYLRKKKEKQAEFEKFNKMKIELYEKEFKKKADERKEEEDADKKKEQREEELKKNLRKNKLPKMLAQSEEIKAKGREIAEERKKKYEEVKDFFIKQETTFKQLFNYLASREENKGLDAKNEKVSLKMISKFLNRFDLMPLIITFNDVKGWIDEMGREGVNGLKFWEFMEFLLRIVIKGQHVFNKIGELMKKTGVLQVDEKQNIENKMTEDQNQPQNELEDIRKTNVATLNGLLYYLGFPLDPTQNSLVGKKVDEKMENPVKKPDKIKKEELRKKIEGEGLEESKHLLLGKKETPKKGPEKQPEKP